MNRLNAFLLTFAIAFCMAFTATGQGPSRIAVMANTNGTLLTPTNFFGSNVIAGLGISVVQGAGGKITITGTGTNEVATNFPSIFVTNYIFGTNYTFEVNTNTPTSLLSWEWWTNLSGTLGITVGGTNYNGIFVTNLIFGTNYTFATATNTPHGIMTWEWLTNIFGVMGVGTSNNSILVAITNNAAPVTNGVILYVTPSAIGDGIKGREDKPYALTNAMDALTSGDTMFLAAGRYTNNHAMLHGAVGSPTFSLVGLTNLTFTGPGAEIYSPTGMCVIQFSNCSGILIDSLKFQSERTAGNVAFMSNYLSAGFRWATIQTINSEEIEFRNLSFSNLFHSAIMADLFPGTFAQTNGFKVIGCRFSDSGLDTTPNLMDYGGPAIRSSGGWEIRNNLFERCTVGIFTYPSIGLTAADSDRSLGCTISGNRFVDNNYADIFIRYTVPGTRIYDNTFLRKTNLTLPYLWDRSTVGGGLQANAGIMGDNLGFPNSLQVQGNTIEGHLYGINDRVGAGDVYATNVLISGNTFSGQFLSPMWTQCGFVSSKVVNNSMDKMDYYAWLCVGNLLDSQFVWNNISDFDGGYHGHGAIDFKLCDLASNVVIMHNTFTSPTGTSKSRAIVLKDVLSAPTNCWHMIIGNNYFYNVQHPEYWGPCSNQVLRADTYYIWKTNSQLMGFVMPFVTTNWSGGSGANGPTTNWIPTTNWVLENVVAPAASATNAISTVQIQGTNIVSLTATNISFWEGLNVTLHGTNQGNGKASIRISAGIGVGGDQYSEGSMVLTNASRTGVITNHYPDAVNFSDDLTVNGLIVTNGVTMYSGGVTFPGGLTQTNSVTNVTVAAGANITVGTNVTGTNVIYTITGGAGAGDVYAANNNVFTGRNTFTNTVTASNLWDRSNVKWWGATGDGVTDDAAAIRACINATTTNGTVHFPPGTYALGSPVHVTNGMELRGDRAVVKGVNTPYLFALGPTNMAVSDYDNRYYVNGISFQGSTWDLTNTIRISDFTIHSEITSCYFQNAPAIDVFGPTSEIFLAGHNWGVRIFENVFKPPQTVGGIGVMLSESGSANNAPDISHNYFMGNSTSPAIFVRGAAARICNNTIEGRDNNIVLDSGTETAPYAHSVLISGNYFENSATNVSGNATNGNIQYKGTNYGLIIRDNYCNLSQPGATNYFLCPFDANSKLESCLIDGNRIFGLTNYAVMLNTPGTNNHCGVNFRVSTSGAHDKIYRLDNLDSFINAGTPGGDSFMLQFNNGGVFAGLTNSTVSNAVGTIWLPNLVVWSNLTVVGTQAVGQLETATLIVTNPINSTSISNATASKLAIFGADNLLTNSAYSDTNFVGMLKTNSVTVGGTGLIVRQVTGGIELSNTMAAASGEANVNGEISVTNSTRMGLVYGKSDVTNLLRSIMGGNGIILINEGTNVMIESQFGNAFDMVSANLLVVSNYVLFTNMAVPVGMWGMGTGLYITNKDGNGYRFDSQEMSFFGSARLYGISNFYTGDMVTNSAKGIVANPLVTNGITLTNATGSNHITFKATNLTAGLTFGTTQNTNTTNTILFALGVPAVGEVFKVHSVSGQTAIVTNGTAGASTLPTWPNTVSGFQCLIQDPTGAWIWARPIILEEFMTGASSTATQQGGTPSSGGTANQSWDSIGPPATLTGDREGFCNLYTYSTNGVGSTHYAALRYNPGLTWMTPSNTMMVVEGMFQTASGSNIVKIGLVTTVSSTNDGRGIWFEYNPQFWGNSNWHVVCKAAITVTNDTGFWVPTNEWWNLGWYGNSNRMVFYTNGAPAFTNESPTSMPHRPTTDYLTFAAKQYNGATNGPDSGPVVHITTLNKLIFAKP